MILYPAIDLKSGQCVRLLRGAMEHATVFNANPADQARRFEAAGFEWLHVVDLDGAVQGRLINAAAVEAILKAVRIPVQLGGGIRDMEAIASWLGRGIARVIVGTAALADPDLVGAACARFPQRVAASIDARGGRVATHGWLATSETSAMELAGAVAERGVVAIIHTDIDRDGALGGVNVAATAALARAVPVPVIASGGVASLADLEAVRAERIIAGIVVGRALYDGRVEPETALALLREAPAC